MYPESIVLTQLTFLELDSGVLPSICFEGFLRNNLKDIHYSISCKVVENIICLKQVSYTALK